MSEATIVVPEVVTQATPEVEVNEQERIDNIVKDRLAREKTKWSKDLGIGEEFTKEGYAKFKEYLESQKSDAEKLKEKAETYETKYNELLSQRKSDKIELGVKDILSELNIDTKHLKTILKLADLSGVYDNELDTNKLKEAISKTLEEELPMLLTNERVKVGVEKISETPKSSGKDYLDKKYANNPYYRN